MACPRPQLAPVSRMVRRLIWSGAESCPDRLLVATHDAHECVAGSTVLKRIDSGDRRPGGGGHETFAQNCLWRNSRARPTVPGFGLAAIELWNAGAAVG